MSSSPVVTVPSCSAHVSANSYSASAAARFDLENREYYKDLIKVAIPGAVFGVLCWIAALLFIVWLLTLCCRRTYWRRWKTTDGVKDASGNRIQARRPSAIPVILLMVLLTCGAIGVGVWGIIEGIHNTNGAVDDFFGVITDFGGELTNISTSANVLEQDASSIQVSLTSTTNVLNSSPTLRAGLQALGYDVNALLAEIASASSSITSGISGAQSAVNGLTGAQGTLNNVAGYKGTADNVNHTYRPLAIALLFGLICLACILVTLCACIGRTPRLTAFFLVILWIFCGFILLIGAGAVKAPLKLSKDGCLYAETYIQRRVTQDNSNPTKVAQINAGISYYAGKTSLTPAQAFQQIFGVDLTSLTSFTSSTQVNNLLTALRDPSSNVRTQVDNDATISATDRTNIDTLPTRIDATLAQVPVLQNTASSANITPLYVRAKQLICCTLVTILQQVWLALTICGALAGAVAILATATVMLAVGKTNNQQMESQEYVRYPLQVHAHGNGPRGAMLRPNGSLSATA